ncbi:MAG TPA: beta-ketoacyl synthase N-terminal-like domain-containing protein [Rhizobacter sp.]|jgi:3-oxoacyl-[acyl-carrier-protein] synthase-1|nr:beta-ketoacyl synthase N-terminal-like domain-containing protein [Rhizobacter sp.]
MNQAYLAGRGLASVLGPDLATAVGTLASGGAPSAPLNLPNGTAWPYRGIDDTDGDWTARARRIVQRVAAESGALGGSRSGPLFVASSSLDIGLLEDHIECYDSHASFADTVATWIDWRGPVFTISTACTSALNALLSARTLIRHGQADHALVLGLELRNRVTPGGFAGMQLLSPTSALPFGAQRNGLVLGEAVAALHLSSQPARWRIAGGANVVDGRDPAGPVPQAVVAMCEQALADAALQPHDIALIKPQAAGGVASDATEALALRQVFAPLPALVSLKAALGHTLGAAGAAELALLTACLEAGVWPPVDYPQDAALAAPLASCAPAARHLLASILGFGGGHSAVVLEDCDA